MKNRTRPWPASRFAGLHRRRHHCGAAGCAIDATDHGTHAHLVNGFGRDCDPGHARVALINAVTVVAEVGDFPRFGNARQLMTYLGLVPSEHSSGIRVRRGGITKAGNAQARRALIEGAWTYRMQARVSRKLHDRLETLPQDIRDIAWKAQARLCSRWRRLAAAAKPKVVVTTGIAREMAGFIWAIAEAERGQGILATCYEPA
jgi:Transposase IS116/IS110/IS902 family